MASLFTHRTEVAHLTYLPNNGYYLVHAYGFQSRERDQETQLNFHRGRYYNTAIGRWISEDPIGFAAGDANLNRFVGNSPTNLTDPDGEWGRGGSQPIRPSGGRGGGRSGGGGSGNSRPSKPGDQPRTVEEIVQRAQARRAQARQAHNIRRAEQIRANSTRGWKVGDPINNLTAAGNVPSWSAVRARIWKNEAFYNPSNNVANQIRMQMGLAPQQWNAKTQRWESKTFHHDPPQRDGGLFEVIPAWPQQHGQIDQYYNPSGGR